jgi:2'-5' RNA ligase
VVRKRRSGRPDTAQPAERARLFVALELPLAIRVQLEKWRDGQLAELDGLRVVEPEALHVTLCFLGWRPVDQIERIADVCAAAASGQPEAELVLGGPVWLGTRRSRVLAVELRDVLGTLAALQRAIAGALGAAGLYEPETRPFLAHVTVARVRRSGRVARRGLEPPASIAFPAGQVTLFRSWAGLGEHRGPDGARYEALRTTSLRA